MAGSIIKIILRFTLLYSAKVKKINIKKKYIRKNLYIIFYTSNIKKLNF